MDGTLDDVAPREDAALHQPPTAKRQRVGAAGAVDTADAPARYALVCCCDAPEDPVEVDVHLLRASETVLYKTIAYDAPDELPDTHRLARRPFWRTGMTRAMLCTMLRSLRLGELSLGADVSLEEALATFEYEGVIVGRSNSRMLEACAQLPARSLETLHFAPPKCIRPPRDGVANARLHPNVAGEVPTETLQTTCERVAHALCVWPRLRLAMDAALSGGYANASVSSTRAWVTFVPKAPCLLEVITHDGRVSDPPEYDLAALAREMPHWLHLTLSTIGALHYRLYKEGTIASRDDRGDEALAKLVTAIETQPLGPFAFAPLDLPQGAAPRREFVKGSKFAREIVAAVLPSTSSRTVMDMLTSAAQRHQNVAVATPVGSAGHHAHAPTQAAAAAANAANAANTNDGTVESAEFLARKEQSVLYAKTIMSIATRLYLQTANLTTLFGAVCTDDDGTSPERTALARALDNYGIRLVRWAGDRDQTAVAKSLLFPPMWAQDARAQLHASTGAGASNYNGTYGIAHAGPPSTAAGALHDDYDAPDACSVLLEFSNLR